MNYAITAYPLSNSFQKRLGELIGTPINYLLLTELRKLPLLKLLKTLRGLDASSLLLPFEDNNSLVLLPILTGIAAFTKTKTTQIIFPDLQRKKNTKWQIFKVLFQLLIASLSSYLALWHSQYQMKKLLKTQPLTIILNKKSSSLLYLNSNLWFGLKAGGSVGHIAGVVNALAEQGLEIHYASINGNTSINSSVKYSAIQPPKNFGIPAELNYYRFNQQIVKQLIKNYKNLPLKFIYQRISIANYAGVIISRYFKIPLVVEYNGSEVWVAKNWGKPLRFHNAALMAEDICLKHAHHVVTISKVLKDELLERGIEPEKIIYYPNCIDPKIFNPGNYSSEFCINLRKQYQIPQESILLTFVGTFGTWHGVDILAKAIDKLISQNESWLIKNKMHFMLVGDGVKMPTVKAILDNNKCKPYVTFTGLIPQQETPGYLAISDILLSPHIANSDGSKFFGSPTKLFEYMAMGKTILASNLEQIGDVLKNSLHADNLSSVENNDDNTSKLAVLCKPGSVEELITGIRFLAEHPELRAKLGCNARKEALTKYTWEKHVNEFLEKIK